MKGRKIKVDILMSTLTLVFLSLFSLILFNHLNNKSSMKETAEEFIESIGHSFIIDAETKFKFWENMASTYGPLYSEENKFSILSENMPLNLMNSTVNAFSEISSIYTGYEDGFFRAVLLGDEKSSLRKDKKKTAPQKTHYRIKNVTNGVEDWFYLNSQNEVILEENDFKTGFDPRERPWYELVKKKDGVCWTDVYVFTGAINEPGITVASPIKNESNDIVGVLGIDLTLSQLKKTLKETKITDHSHFYIVNNKTNEIVVASDKTDTFKSENSKFKLIKIDELETNHLLRYMLKIDKNEKKPKQLNFIFKGENFALKKMNFTDPNFSSWSLVVIYPHNDVIGKFQKASIQSLYISLFIFFVSTLFMYILSVRFSKPIMKLAREAEQIRELQLKGNVEVHSNLKEIAILATSMDSMKASLRSFALYMPRDLVRYLLKENKEITIGGEEKEITIFFSDIEGFTSISENIKPEEIANRLSGYFSLMGDSISQYNGTIDKFIGDAVMAFWGAPHDDDMHIEHACRAALMAQSLLEVFNADLVKQGFSPFRTRIGIHTGLSVVGNIGSNDRMNYTVLGDNVNLASRLEALNKHYGSLILISQAVKDKLPSSFITRPLDKVAVKGKEHGTVILELMGCSDIKTVHSYEKMKEMAELFQNAFELYLDRSWNDAIEAFEKIQLLYPDDMPTKILLKRCKDFSETPPDENWNGAFHMKEK